MSEFGSAIAAGINQATQLATVFGGAALQYKYNKKLAEQQNQYNLDMWKMQADYNSPQSQMERFRAAGLNPNLMYGQGNSGNMSSAPQLMAAQPPDVQKAASDIAKAFNFQELALNYYRIKEAKEESRIKQLERYTLEDMRQGQADFGSLYNYNPTSGRFDFVNQEYVATAKNPRGSRPGDRPTNSYWFNQNFMNSDKNWLYPYRQQLYDTQKRYLQPMVLMNQYEQRFQPYSFWIDRGARVLNALPLPKFNFKFNKATGGFLNQTDHYLH